MRLLECIAYKPGLFNNINLQFGDAVTIVYGKNESGKTLLAKAMIDTLWGEFSGCSSLNGNVWDDLHFEISFSNFSARYRFIRNKKELFMVNYLNDLEDNLNKEKQILRRAIKDNNNDDSLSIKLYEATNDSETVRLFNKIDIKTFMSTSFLADPVDIARNGRMDYSTVQRFLLNDNSNFYMLYENISDVFSNNAKVADSHNSVSNEILKMENELKKVERKIQIISLKDSKSDRLFKEKDRLEQELKNFNNELSKVREHKNKLLNIQNNLKKLDDINKSIKDKNEKKQIERDKIDSISKMEADIKQQYPQFCNFEESNIKNLKKIQETFREVRDIYEEIENFHSSRADKKNKFKNIILAINFSSIIILSAVFAISSYIFPIFLLLLNEYKIHFILGFLTLSVTSSFLFFLYYLASSRPRDLRQIMKKKSDVEKKLEETLQKNNIILSEYKLEVIYEYLAKYFEEYGEYSISQSEIAGMKEALNGQDYITLIDKEIEELKRDEKIIKLEIDKDIVSFSNDSPIDLDIEKVNALILSKNQKIKDLKDNISQTNNIILQVEEEIKHASRHTAELAAFNKEINSIREVLKKLYNFKITIEYIANLLKEAIGRREVKQMAELVNKVYEIFHFLTGQQYRNMINEDVIRKVIKGELPNEEMNMSVLHTLLLSLKFAITGIFSELDIDLPLIIDEPFSQMDNQRIDRFKKILDETAARRQVIIFTHDSKYKDWGTFIEL